MLLVTVNSVDLLVSSLLVFVDLVWDAMALGIVWFMFWLRVV